MGCGKTVALTTLGCKLNFSETSTIARAFKDRGFNRVEFNEVADVYIINSCSVTNSADKKSRTYIKQAAKQNPAAFIIVTGCYAQLKPDEVIKIDGVDLVVGAKDKLNIDRYIDELNRKEKKTVLSCDYKDIENFSHAYSFGDRTRTFLKVQDGCNYFCSYCTIPMARGKSRNPSIESIVLEAKTIAAGGTKEIILTGINIGDFGRSTGENFFDLIKELDLVEGIERIRISSIEPNLLTDEMIDFIATSNRIAPHFHIPLQSGSDKMLDKMRRKYDTELFRNKISTINSKIPHAFIGVDIIVGMHGETIELFNDSVEFVKSLKISQLHIFPYSEREGTKAVKFDGVVPVKERKDRVKTLQAISNTKLKQFYRENILASAPVLFETNRDKEIMTGWTDNYIKVEMPFDKDSINKVKTVTLEKLEERGDTPLFTTT